MRRRVPPVTRSRRVAAASRKAQLTSQAIEKRGDATCGAWRTQRRSRAGPCASTTCRSVSVVASVIGSQPGGSVTGCSGSGVSSTTTSGAASGDHSAGCFRGSECGAVGKAQAPPPGQTLLFRQSTIRGGDYAVDCCVEICTVVGITAQKFLCEVREIVAGILLGKCGRAPRQFTRHSTLHMSK